jgi:hypothetical protein
MGSKSSEPRCVECDRTGQQIPLIPLEYRNQKFWICPQHLPMLIHDPRSLAGKLPGAEGMEAAEHHD